MSENQLVLQILDSLKTTTLDMTALDQLADQIMTSADARDYFQVLADDPRLAELCSTALTARLSKFREERDTLQKTITSEKASLAEAEMLLHEMQHIPTIVSREQLKQMVLLVMLQHNAKEAV